MGRTQNLVTKGYQRGNKFLFQIKSIDIENKCDLLETDSEFESWLYQLLAKP